MYFQLAGSDGNPQQPYFTRNSISEALLMGTRLTQLRSPLSTHSLIWKLYAQALYLGFVMWDPMLASAAKHCVSSDNKIVSANDCIEIKDWKGVTNPR